VRWERKDWLVFVLTKVAFLWLFGWWGVEWGRTLIVLGSVLFVFLSSV